ncbi:TLD-domain containing nucleolar protein [Actinidia rufa]|uniref:TLD-domain containing nucleolar protein n=1 Tax=Actinidia rufa TaxID=165716 RepID=A0A7J0GDM1_9ERIC|nr:TLD-domain containing nucleolar protein [Actinidia rufa]
MGNAQSPYSDPRFASASRFLPPLSLSLSLSLSIRTNASYPFCYCRAFTQKGLEDLKALFASLAAQSQSNGHHISSSVFKDYFGIHGPLGDRMFDLVSQRRHDQKLTFEDLVIAKAFLKPCRCDPDVSVEPVVFDLGSHFRLDSEQLGYRESVLLCLEAVLGLWVTLAKLEVTPVDMICKLASLAAIHPVMQSWLPLSILFRALGSSLKPPQCWLSWLRGFREEVDTVEGCRNCRGILYEGALLSIDPSSSRLSKGGTYEKGTKDEIEEFIYQLLDVTDNGIVGRSDVKAVLMEILDDILCQRSSVPGSNSHQDIVGVFLNAANFSKSNEGCAESSMSFEDFRRWCALFPSVRKYLGSLLSPSDTGVLYAGRPGSHVPHLLHSENVESNSLLLKNEYAWHIGGALSQQELDEWKLLYHSAFNGLSFNTFLGNIANDEGPTVLIIKDREGYIYGGYASQPWERHADFYGDMKSFLFQLYPRASIFKPTGANNNLQWVSLLSS